MDLANERVLHKRFGEGRIVRHDDSYVEIGFPLGNKRFVFPDAFGTYVKLVNQKAARWARQMIQQRKKEREAIELERNKRQARAAKKRERLLAEGGLFRSSPSRRSSKVHPQSQSVFWCTEEELGNVFMQWDIFAGAIKSGRKKGLPRRLARINKNTACLLTVRSSHTKEQNRRIVGAFLVNGTFKNKPGGDGIIPAHPEFRTRLSEQESERMLFWNYYINKRYPKKMTWNSGRHRYFDNIWMAQILRDIISLKEDPQEHDLARRFFQHFCQINVINIERLSQPSGVLVGMENL